MNHEVLLCNVQTARLVRNGLLVYLIIVFIFRIPCKCVKICEEGLRLCLVVDNVLT